MRPRLAGKGLLEAWAHHDELRWDPSADGDSFIGPFATHQSRCWTARGQQRNPEHWLWRPQSDKDSRKFKAIDYKGLSHWEPWQAKLPHNSSLVAGGEGGAS